MFSRETWAEVSLDNIKENYQFIKNELKNTQIVPVVKANAYGHGDFEVASIFDKNPDVPFLCVASLDEAISLSSKGIEKDILIFSYVNPKFVLENNNSQFIFTIPSLDWYLEVSGKARFHLEINTGMNRMGVKDKTEINQIIEESVGDIEGIYTHFISSEYEKRTLEQLNRFEEILKDLKCEFKFVHAGNVSYELYNEAEIFNACRIGLALYGYKDAYELKPALSLFSQVIYIEKVKAGETIGYSYAYEVKDNAFVATIPIGYADGFFTNQSHLDVFINHNKFKIVGGTCMDQSMILCDDTVSIGDTVELISPRRTAKMIADINNMKVYEVLVLIGNRVNRIYK